MDHAKIRLSPKEMELVTNTDWILTKNHIINKVKGLLVSVMNDQMPLLQSISHLDPEIIQSTPKISRGENYQGLPYMILDYPRIFSKENICAIRTMFWWGHFISITLHLSGSYKTRHEKKIISKWETLREAGYYVAIGKNEWDHHFESHNYLPLSSMSVSDIDKNFRNLSFIKLAKKIPLQQWDDMPELISGIYRSMLELLTD